MKKLLYLELQLFKVNMVNPVPLAPKAVTQGLHCLPFSLDTTPCKSKGLVKGNWFYFAAQARVGVQLCQNWICLSWDQFFLLE